MAVGLVIGLVGLGGGKDDDEETPAIADTENQQPEKPKIKVKL